jgi:N-formylglutamate amidohydrolase
MPSYGPPREVRKGVYADFVLGDRDGSTCEPDFTEFVARFLRGLGYDVRVNEGYKGVEIVRRQGRPAERRHSLQIEVDRALYMDQKTLEKLPGFDRLQGDLADLVAAIASFIRDRL